MSNTRTEPVRRLLLSDIDGTFIYGNQVPPDNYRAVREFEAAGNFFSFATGRDEREIHIIEPAMREIMNAPAVMCNGAYLYDFQAEERLEALTLDPVYAYDLLHKIEAKFGRTYTRLTFQDRWHHYYDEPDDGILDQTWLKIIIGGKSDYLDAIRDYVRAIADGRVFCCKSGPELLEILNPSASKGEMLRRLRRRLEARGIALKVYAIGDFENDISMLQQADVSACPANAAAAVKAAADYEMGDCREGAVAQFIDRILQGDI